MRVRQCRLSGRRVPGSGFCVWRSDSNRYSGSALASCLPCWLCQLMHYSTHLTRKRELSYTTTDRALDARMALVASTGFRLVQCSFLLCRYEKAQGVNLGLEFFVSTIKAMATISDLHEIYTFQFGFARVACEFVAFCCERDRVTEISAPLSSRLKLLRIASQ